MSRISDSKTWHHVVIAIIMLLVAMVMLGAANCDDAGSYQLTVSSTGGGSVTAPGEGTRTYAAGTVVQIVAKADQGYEFRGWSGDTGQIANHNSASTTITMNDNYSITASFASRDDESEAVPVP